MKALTVLLLGVLFASVVQAQEPYPSRPVKLILPFPPGGPTDILGRLIAENLSVRLGQPVITENRGGAGGNVGAEAAARSAPDGYSLVLVAPSLAISPTLYAKLNYDPIKDFAPIALVAQVPNVMVTHPSVPATTLAEFIAYARANPGKLNFGSGGLGTSNHLAGELFNLRTGAGLIHVPYKGVNLAMNGVLAGEVHLVFLGVPVPAPHIKAARLRGLAVLGRERSPLIPEGPTAAEAGLGDFDVTTWSGVLAPAGTPRPIIQRLNAELTKMMQAPDIKERLAALGTDPLTSTPEEFGAYIKQEIAKWGDVIRKAGLHAE